MGLCNFNFHFPAEGVMLVFVLYTFVSLALLKKTVQSMLELVGAATSNSGEHLSNERFVGSRARRVSITRYESLRKNRCRISARSRSSGNIWGAAVPVDNCSVCLCGFEANEEVSELSCKHFFHKGCLQQWFDSRHSSCPLCRSVI